MAGLFLPLELTLSEFLELVAGGMTAATALFAGLLLLGRDHDARMRALGLAIFLLATALSELDELAMLGGAYIAYPHLAMVFWPVTVVIGPAILLYVRDMTAAQRQPLTPMRLVRYFWSVPAGYVIALPFYFLPADSKLALFAGETDGLELAAAVPLVLMATFLVIAFVSLVIAYRALLVHTRSVRNLFANIEDKSLSWVRVVLFVLSAAWIWGAVMVMWRFDNSLPGWQGLAATVLELGWVFAFGFFGVRQAAIYKPVAPAPSVPAGKYHRSALDAPRMERIAGRVATAMEERKLYRDSTLSLRQLSDEIRVSENYISQTLNDQMGRNFFDYVNAWRIGEACQRLAAGARILETAHATGFNSRSTFNAAFRKHTGMTPSAWRQEPEGWPDGLPRPDTA